MPGHLVEARAGRGIPYLPPRTVRTGVEEGAPAAPPPGALETHDHRVSVVPFAQGVAIVLPHAEHTTDVYALSNATPQLRRLAETASTAGSGPAPVRDAAEVAQQRVTPQKSPALATESWAAAPVLTAHLSPLHMDQPDLPPSFIVASAGAVSRASDVRRASPAARRASASGPGIKPSSAPLGQRRSSDSCVADTRSLMQSSQYSTRPAVPGAVVASRPAAGGFTAPKPYTPQPPVQQAWY